MKQKIMIQTQAQKNFSLKTLYVFRGTGKRKEDAQTITEMMAKKNAQASHARGRQGLGNALKIEFMHVHIRGPWKKRNMYNTCHEQMIGEGLHPEALCKVQIHVSKDHSIGEISCQNASSHSTTSQITYFQVHFLKPGLHSTSPSIEVLW